MEYLFICGIGKNFGGYNGGKPTITTIITDSTTTRKFGGAAQQGSVTVGVTVGGQGEILTFFVFWDVKKWFEIYMLFCFVFVW